MKSHFALNPIVSFQGCQSSMQGILKSTLRVQSGLIQSWVSGIEDILVRKTYGEGPGSVFSPDLVHNMQVQSFNLS